MATAATVAFSRRHGFDVHVEVDLTDGPHICILVRTPLVRTPLMRRNA